MIFWYTGAPGHGKTLHAIEHALRFRDEGRPVYVCNVNGFKYEEAHCHRMEPEDFRNWMDFLPDGAVALVDEAYEHGMLPKRPPGSKVPPHVEQLAKHRHRGLDFIFVSQSPAKQIDEFIHDLIERQVHCRRFYGLPLVKLKKFDYLERNPVKAHANATQWVRLPKRPRGLYTSTVMDTSASRLPAHYVVFAIALPVLGYFGYNNFMSLDAKTTDAKPITGAKAGGTEHGALATGEGPTVVAKPATPTREQDYWGWLQPRIVGQPWTAPAYDRLNVPQQAPRIFCAATGAGEDAQGEHQSGSCTCVTEQGTRYALEEKHCRMLAREGQYEPFRDEVIGDRRRLDDGTQRRELAERMARASEGAISPAGGSAPAPSAGSVIDGSATLETQPQAHL